MQDTLVKALSKNGHIRFICCTTTNLCEQARLQHDLWPTSAAALGRCLTAGCMMGSMLKGDNEKVTITINGNGPIGTIMVDAHKNGDVRGFVGDPQLYLKYNDSNKLAVGQVVGNQGYLKVIKDMQLKENFVGQVKLVSGEIAEDFAYYFTVSEQTPSAVSLGVLVDTDNSVKAAGGLIIQMMPDATEEDIILAENIVKGLRPISEIVDEGKSASDILKAIMPDIEILSESPVQWHCDCSRDRFKAALTTLANDDLEEMINDDKGCEIKCEYCNTTYEFTTDDLKFILGFKKSCGR